MNINSDEDMQDKVQQEYCLILWKNEFFIQFMIILFSFILTIVGIGIFLLYKQRDKYPIKERSYMLSIYMMYCFYCLTVYYPIVYIVLHFKTNYQLALLVLKWIYMQAQFGLYISYFTRSLRIYAAFTKSITEYFSNENESSEISQYKQSKLIKWVVKLLKSEWQLTLLTAIISNILCIPLIVNSNFYLIPIENYNHSKDDLLFAGDLETAFAYQFTVGIFIFQIHILRKVPKHYRFHKESILNFITQWAKASIFFLISNLLGDVSWCNYKSQINIAFNYFQFISMIYISTCQPLIRSQYVPAPLPFPQLANFNEFIEDEGDDNNIFCNRSFIAFLDSKDGEKRREMAQQQQQEIPETEYRQNLNIYEFYFETKAILLNDNNDKNSMKKKEDEFIKIVNFYIAPKNKKYLLKFPNDFQNNIERFTNHYIKNEEFNQNYRDQGEDLSSSINDEGRTLQSQFIDEIIVIQEQCIRYLKEVFEEYLQTNAFNHIQEYYEEQKSFQTNLNDIKKRQYGPKSTQKEILRPLKKYFQFEVKLRQTKT